ncbi:MAG TPA: ATPase P, partial [Ruminococcaceae bacterium]|nr:ATPase P [Oscillospiraceae bacterium]
AQKITASAKYIKKPNSEILTWTNRIIKFIGFAIIPIGGLLFYKQIAMSDQPLQDAVVSTVAALIGMIPEGLVLLSSVVLAVGVLRLSRRSALVQELYSIETLARVDTLCLDKTGTIT